jgi:hypothetical protein
LTVWPSTSSSTIRLGIIITGSLIGHLP